MFMHLWLKYSRSRRCQYYILDADFVGDMVQENWIYKASFVGLYEWAHKNFKACTFEILVIVVACMKGLHWSLLVIDDSSTLHMDSVKRYHNIRKMKVFSQCVSKAWVWSRGVTKSYDNYHALVHACTHHYHVPLQIDSWECGCTLPSTSGIMLFWEVLGKVSPIMFQWKRYMGFQHYILSQHV